MKILIAIPCADKIDTLFASCLINLRHRNILIGIEFLENSLVYDARTQLVNKAIDDEYDRILWVDSDMVFSYDMLERLSARLDEGAEYVSALAFTRRTPYRPAIYSEITEAEHEGKKYPIVKPMEDYPENSFFEIKGSGFGCVMTSVDLCRKVRDEYSLPFSPRLGFGEDVTFCIECGELCAKMYCDSSIKVGHISRYAITEETYRRARNAVQHNNPSV